MRSCKTILLAGLAIAASACAGADTTAPLPERAQQGPQSGAGGTGGSGDTTTTPPSFPASVQISGHVYSLTSVQPTVPGGDSLRYTPIAGVRLQFVRNQLVNGTVTTTVEGEATSGTSGEFSVSGIPGGYYQVRSVLPADSKYFDSISFVTASSLQNTTDVYLGSR